MIIAIDFDGTVVTHEFPKVGQDIGAVPYLKALIRDGHQLILHTMRSDGQHVSTTEPLIHNEVGNYLSDAVRWFADHGIELYGVNRNPTQHTWTASPKTYAHLYIDDAALGVPLVIGKHERSYVDWPSVAQMMGLRIDAPNLERSVATDAQ